MTNETYRMMLQMQPEDFRAYMAGDELRDASREARVARRRAFDAARLEAAARRVPESTHHREAFLEAKSRP